MSGESSGRKVFSGLSALFGLVVGAILGSLGTWLFERAEPYLEDPLRASINEPVDAICQQFAISRDELDGIPITNGNQIDGRWVVSHGGLPLAPRVVEMTLHGRGDAVVVHSVEIVDFVRRQTEGEMIIVSECAPTGGELPVRNLSVDMSGEVPVLAPGDAPLQFPYTVANDDPEVFSIYATNIDESCFCTWKFRVRWSDGTRDGQLLVDGSSVGVGTAIRDRTWPMFVVKDGQWREWGT